ncbi:MAG: serine/threonine-protein kinase [Pseudomonadota bacterium]
MNQSNDALERRVLQALDEAFSKPSNERAAWVRQRYADDRALLDRVLSLLAAEGDGAGRFPTGGASRLMEEDVVPERAGAYKIDELIGSGGMGAVYSGSRDVGDFDHKVAIKVIRPGVLSDVLIERFETERQILASLNHPGIARLFDGGTLDDGSPFIIMEFVEGTPITDWADQNGLSVDDRLWVFSDVCTAVEYAHQNLIIHRDITPSNVLIDKAGAVKLIDFGIAKPTAEDDGITGSSDGSNSLNSLSFTPGFAAPERGRGAPANTLSDIFSLGKLLEALLAKRSVDADLSAIITRAAAIDPNDRYASVSSMMDDIRNYRQGFPVEARKGGEWYKLKKYFRRRRLMISSAALGVLALSTALVVTWSQYQTAKTERAAADARFEEVRALSSFMMFDLYDELEKAPGNTKAIEMLAERSQAYLESLEKDERASLDVKIETGAGLKRLADILGNPKNQNLGRRADAGILLDRAGAYLAALHENHLDNDDLTRKLADTKFANAVHKYVSDDDSERAHILAKEAAELFQPLAKREGASYSDQSNFIRARMMSAVPLPWISRDEEGIAILREVRSEAAQLVANDPESLDAKNLLGSMNVELARAIIRYENNGGDTEDTLPIWDEAIALRLEVNDANPDDARAYRSLVSIYSERSAVLRGWERYEESLRDLAEAERIGLELLAIDPDDAWLKRVTQGAQEERIKTLTFSGRHTEAVQRVEAAYPVALEEYVTNQDNSGYVREWGYTLIIFATAYLDAGLSERGCTIVQSSRDAWTQFDEMAGISDADQNVSIQRLERLEERCVEVQ